MSQISRNSLDQAYSTRSSRATCCPWRHLKWWECQDKMRKQFLKLTSYLFMKICVALLLRFVVVWLKSRDISLSFKLRLLQTFTVTINLSLLNMIYRQIGEIIHVIICLSIFYCCTVHCGIYILFTHQQIHFLLNLEKFKFTWKYT